MTNTSPEQSYYIDQTFNGSANGTTQLKAWDGQPANIGVALGEDYRSLFYIGTDKSIHQLSSFPNKNNKTESVNTGTWNIVEDQDKKYWPLADEANANFGMAGWLDDKGGHVYLYYMVGGSLTLAMYENNTWFDAEQVPTVLPPKGEGASASSKKKGLSDGAKAGIGVGAFFGAFALVALFGAIIFIRRRRRRQKQEEEGAAAAAAQLQAQQIPPYQPEGMYQAYSPYHQQGQMPHMSGQPYTYVPAISPELLEPKPETGAEVNELPERNWHSYEMLGEGHFREMPAAARFEEPSPSSEVGDIPIRRG